MTSPPNLSQRAAWAEGQPISDLMARALAAPRLVSLAAGFVDPCTLPLEATREAFDSLWQREGAAQDALQYGTTAGHEPLREQIVTRQIASDGGSLPQLDIDRVVVTAGSNQMLHLVAETLLDPGDIVLCASPTYLVFLGTLRNLGARAVGIDADEEGMLPDALEAQLKHLEAAGELPRVKAIYLISYFDNPCGATLSAERRRRIMETAQRWSRRTKTRRNLAPIYVIEDAAYRELRFEGDDTPSMFAFDEAESELLILAGTFSKSFSPGVRVGWGILPRELVAPICDQKGSIDFGSPNFNQHLMAEVLQGGQFDTHVALLQASYRKKRDAMLQAMEDFLGPIEGCSWRRPQGGLYVWARAPETVDTAMDGPLFDVALKRGVLYVPGRYCFPTEGAPPATNTMRLSFGVQSCAEIRRGVQSLAEAIEFVVR